MKLAITSLGTDTASEVDPRFGRARHFIVIDSETGAWTAVDNQMNLNAAQGAGIQAGKNVIALGVGGVVTGHVGPKAFATLRAGDVSIYTGAKGTVAQALEQFKAGTLQLCDSADVEGHWV